MIWGGPGSYGKKWNPEAIKEGYSQLGSNICSPDTVEGICELYPSAKKNAMERQLIQRQRGIFLFTHPLLLSQKVGRVWRLRKVHRVKEKQFEGKDQHKYFSPILIRGCDHVQCFVPQAPGHPSVFWPILPKSLGGHGDAPFSLGSHSHLLTSHTCQIWRGRKSQQQLVRLASSILLCDSARAGPAGNQNEEWNWGDQSNSGGQSVIATVLADHRIYTTHHARLKAYENE